MYWRIISAIYGFTLGILGAILLGIELGSLDDTCTTVWSKMSSNQKLYFDNSFDNLKSERSKNVLMCGFFSISVGVMVIISAVTQQLLFSEGALRWKAPSTSRLPTRDIHEKVDFVWVCYRDDDYDGPHHQQNTQMNRT